MLRHCRAANRGSAGMKFTSRHRAVLALGLCVALGIAGCGRRGPLEAPGAATAPAPQQANSVSTAMPSANAATEAKPMNERFILDALIQ